MFADGTAASPSISFAAGNTTGLFNAGGVLGFATSGTQRLSIGTSGTITVAAPTSSGVSLQVNQLNVGTAGLRVSGPASNYGFLSVQDGQTGTAEWFLISGFTNNAAAPGTFSIYGGASASSQMNFATNGGVWMNGATGGSQGVGTINAQGLYINGVAVGGAAAAGTLTGATLAANVVNASIRNISTPGSGATLSLASGQSVATLSISANNGVPGITINNASTGSGSNTFFDATNAADANCDLIISQSGAASKFATFGPTVAIPFNIQTNSSVRHTVAADGGWFSAGATGGSQGVGTINATGYYVSGFRGLGAPVNTQAGATYTAVAADANGTLQASFSGAKTFTIPANSSVAYPIGTMLTFINGNTGNMTIAITTDVLVFSANNTQGSRTLGVGGMATALKATSGVWYISGSQLT